MYIHIFCIHSLVDRCHGCFHVLATVKGATMNAGMQVSFGIQFSSVAQSCLTLCNPMNCSTPGIPVHHQLPEFTQTHAHRVCDAIQPSHPLSSPSPSAPNPSQHQGLATLKSVVLIWLTSQFICSSLINYKINFLFILYAYYFLGETHRVWY